MKRTPLIVNPTAGQGGPERRKEAIQRFCGLMQARGVDVEIRATAGPGDASRLAAEAAREGYEEVIVSGGDGTINEALQGLVGTGVRMAVWPRGTANVLGRELRLPRDVERLADIIAAGKVQPTYVGCATIEDTGQQRYFLLMAGIGLDAAIVERVRPGLKKRFGKAAFWYSGLENLANWKPRNFTLEISGKEYCATFAALGKTPRYGGDLAITPRARLDRPEFEICLVHSTRRMRYLKLLPCAMFGGVPEGMKEVSFLTASSVRASGEGVLVQVDGELLGALPMSFTVTPHVVEVVTR
jgi:YegS/Rv2252/BmrU family lipid kinase